MRLKIGLLSIILCVLLVPVTHVISAESYNIVTQMPARLAPLSVKLVFIGLESMWVDTGYLVWNELIPIERYQSIQVTDATTGILFKLEYELVFATEGFKAKYVSFLKSIETRKKIKNPWFTYRTWSSEREEYDYTTLECTNVLYDAKTVEDWLYTNRADYGGFPVNGWTFIITYLPELPSMDWSQWKRWGNNVRQSPEGTPHYYSTSMSDVDAGYMYSEREFMKGWGGKYRMWFVDLSAGPIPYTGWADAPLQWMLEDFNIRLGSTHGKTWLTNYLASYIWEAVCNFAAPNFVYDPVLTEEYEIVITFLDHRKPEEKSKVGLEPFVNQDMIRAAFEILCPYTKTTVKMSFHSTIEFEELVRIIEDNHLLVDSVMYHPTSWTKTKKLDYVNMEPVYKYLQNNLGKFVKEVRRDRGKMTIPVFHFVFSGSIRFFYQWKWYIQDYDMYSGTFTGVAQGDIVINGYNHHDLIAGDRADPKQPGKGIGFTRTIIHEVGHMVGLMHPHSYGWLGSFALGAMSYFSRDALFGQHDKDALQRGHADKLFIEAGELVREARATLGTRVKSSETVELVTKAEQQLKVAESDYSKMNYAESVKKLVEALTQTKAAVEKAKLLTTLEQRVTELSGKVETLTHELESTRQLLPVTLVAGLVIGIGVGLVVAKIAARKKEALPKGST